MPLTADGRAAASDLAALILAEGNAVGQGQTAAAAPAAAAALVARLEGAAVPVGATPAQSHSVEGPALERRAHFGAVRILLGQRAGTGARCPWPPWRMTVRSAPLISTGELLESLTSGAAPAPRETAAAGVDVGDGGRRRGQPHAVAPGAGGQPRRRRIRRFRAWPYPEAGPLNAPAAEGDGGTPDEHAAGRDAAAGARSRPWIRRDLLAALTPPSIEDMLAGLNPAVDQEDWLATLGPAVDQVDVAADARAVDAASWLAPAANHEDVASMPSPATDQEDVAHDVFAAAILPVPLVVEETTADGP